MALLFYDGFDDLSDPDMDPFDPILRVRYDYVDFGIAVTSSVSTLIPPPLNGGNAMSAWIWGQGRIILQKTVTAHASGVVGIRILFDSRRFLTYLTTRRLIQLTNTSNLPQLCLSLNENNKLEVRRGNDGTLLGISSFTYQTQSWYYVEFGYTIDSVNGNVTVKVDGNTVLSLSGINTQEQVVAAVNRIGLCPVRGSANFENSAYWYDDFYVVDTTGPSPYNTFLGDIKVLSLKPDGTGSIANWTASSGTTWGAIDDVTLLNSTDFVYTSASNNTDLYTLTNLSPTGSSIYAVKSVVAAKKTDAATATLTPIISTGGILYSASSDFTITTTTTEYSTTFTINPSTSIAWTVSDINSLESGFKSTT